MPQETTTPPVAPIDVASATIVQPTAEDLAGFSFPDQTSVTPPGTEVTPTPSDTTTLVVPPVTTPAPAVETPVTPPAPAAVDTKVSLPARYDGESDVQYNYRTELFLAGQAKANATTEEEKSILAQQIKGIREAMRETAKEVAVPPETTKVTETAPTQPLISPSEEEIAKAQLRKLGFVTEDQIEAELAKRIDAREALRQTEIRQVEQATAAKEFYDSRPDLANDPVKREQFEQLIVNTYLSKMDMSKISKTDFAVMLDSVANYAFPKGNVSKKADESQSKVDLVNFSGGTQAVIPSEKGPSKTVREKLKADGWSDSDIERFTV